MKEDVQIHLSAEDKAKYKKMAAAERLPVSRWITRTLNKACEEIAAKKTGGGS